MHSGNDQDDRNRRGDEAAAVASCRRWRGHPRYFDRDLTPVRLVARRTGPDADTSARPRRRSLRFSIPVVDPPPAAAPPDGTRLIWFEVVPLPPELVSSKPGLLGLLNPPPPEPPPVALPEPFPPPCPIRRVGVGAGTGGPVGRLVGVGEAEGFGDRVGVAEGAWVGVDVEVGVGVTPGDCVGVDDCVGVGAGPWLMLFVRLALQVTVAPPPLPDPLH